MTDEILASIDYRQLCVDMLEAWDLAGCPVLPSDPDVVFERARAILGRDKWLSIDSWPGDKTNAELLQSLKEI